jgi:hypothetical protein
MLTKQERKVKLFLMRAYPLTAKAREERDQAKKELAETKEVLKELQEDWSYT